MREKAGGLIVLSEDKRTNLEAQLGIWVDSAEGEKLEIAQRWQKQRSQYDNEPVPFVSKLMANCQDQAYPFTQPRIDALNDSVISAIFSKSSVLQAKLKVKKDTELSAFEQGLGDAEEMQSPEESQAEQQGEVTEIIQYFFDVGNLEEMCKCIGPDVGTTNHGVLRLKINPDEMTFGFDPIVPDDLIVLGSGTYNMRTAIMAGHAFYPTIEEVLERCKSGEYYDLGEDYQPDPTDGSTENASSKTGEQGQEDLTLPCKLYFLSFSCDVSKVKDRATKRGTGRVSLKKETYLAVYDNVKKKILALQIAPSKRHPYFNFGYIPAPTKGFWNKRSVAHHLQGLHDVYNMAKNVLFYGKLMESFKPIVGKGPGETGQTYGPAKVLTMMGDSAPADLSFNGEDLLALIEDCRRDGDSAIRISQAGMAQESMQNMTATQSVQLAAGQAMGRSGYVSTYVIDLCEMAKEMLHYLEALWPRFYKFHSDALPSEEWKYGPAKLIDFDATGSSPSSNPIIRMQIGKELLEMSDKYSEIKREVALRIFVDGADIREGDDLIRSPEEMAELQAQEAMAAQQGAMGSFLKGLTGGEDDLQDPNMGADTGPIGGQAPEGGADAPFDGPA